MNYKIIAVLFIVYLMTMPELSLSQRTCRQPIDGGPCTERIERWAYYRIANRCIIFFYGGCMGNSNNFPTEEECKRKCVRR
ncbi:kunitz-type kappaPI-theraphotoxin-Hs1e-like [Leptopilina boulardi]|uniref:kunitz-type kappaPI-theraphotoxin-Hs1e-like n=1 Tax=Leptopilina boulardi TaxID=63433 RepID=UPI0021F5E6A9|nr:kunitz-type kappaPI-theraphotoxin-Hs1e-like [Leptopilina boulardi]